jgi:FkbM family methyltransferase
MLIKQDDIIQLLRRFNIEINGAFHIGAHDCEELDFYHNLGLTNNQVVWIDAIESKVKEAQNRNIPNVYQAVITEQDDTVVTFHISNNIQSSSVLPLGTHLQEHPGVYYTTDVQLKSITVDTFFEKNGLDASQYPFWNFDIQGAELMALKGATKSLQYAKAIYLEVNEKELYQNCGLIGEIDKYMAEYNFIRVLTDITSHGWGDALYIRM